MGETSQGFISICPQMPGLGVGPEAVVCSVTERERLTSAYQWQGLTSRLQAGWVSFQVVSQKEAEQLLSVSSGHSFRLKGTGEVCFFSIRIGEDVSCSADF